MSGLSLQAGAQPADNEPVSGALLNRMIAQSVLQVLRGAITSRELGDGSISQVKLSEEFVRTVVLSAGAVTTNKFAEGAVITGSLADNAATAEKIADDVAGDGMTQEASGALALAPDDQTLELSAGKLQAKDLGADTEHFAADAVDEDSIEAGAVTEDKLGTGAVTDDKIGSGAVDQPKIGAYGSHVIDLAQATGANNVNPATVALHESFNVSGLSGNLAAVLVVQYMLQPSYAAGTATLRLEADPVAGVDIMHAIEVDVPATAFKWQTALLVGYSNSAPNSLYVRSQLGTCTGMAIGKIGWRILDLTGIDS